MPTPKKNESKSDFIDRCIPIVIADGTAEDSDQAVAICQSMYEQWKNKQEAKTMKQEIERRNFPVSELRAITDEQGLRRISGYAAIFNTLSEDLGGFREKIAPGAFKETINSDDIRALKNHNDDYVLGRNKSGTLALEEDPHGLKFSIIPPDAQWAKDLMVSIDRGDIDQMSFGFRTLSDRWETKDSEEIRTLEKVKLLDVSPVTFAAYPDTAVALRSLEEHKKDAVPTDGGEGDYDPTVINRYIAEEDEVYRKIKCI